MTAKPITDPELPRRVQGEIATRYAHHVLEIPYQEAITGAELLSRGGLGTKPQT